MNRIEPLEENNYLKKKSSLVNNNNNINLNLERTEMIQEHNQTHEHQKVSCIDKIREIISSNKFHVGVIILVIIDCLVIGSELIIDHVITHLNESLPINKTGNTSFEEYDQTINAINVLHIIELVLKYSTVVILGIFVVEISFKFTLIPKNFFRPLQVFDAIVIFNSFSLNIFLLNHKHVIHSVAGLISILRLWRVTEIINGAVMATKIKGKKKIHILEKRIYELEKENHRLKKSLDDYERQ